MKRPLFLVATLCAAGLVHADQRIESVQETLKEQGFYYGNVTGERSVETTAAIRRYQIRNGLQVTGDINQETLRSLGSSSNSAAAPEAISKPATAPPNSVPPDASSHIARSSPLSSFSQPDRQLQTNPLFSTTPYQSAPLRLNRRIVAGAQQQLIGRGYYRGWIDGRYGPQTAFAVRAFQSSAGLSPTGRLDMQTLNALGSSNTDLAYLAPAAGMYETWIPVTKFKHGKWKVKWKKYYRHRGDERGDEDREENSVYGWDGY